jgi:hypothetical protein
MHGAGFLEPFFLIRERELACVRHMYIFNDGVQIGVKIPFPLL